MIEVKNIFKKFGDNLVLNNVSATFFPGKINLIIGRSGSGKTVAIKSMLGLHKIDSSSNITHNTIYIFKVLFNLL